MIATVEPLRKPVKCPNCETESQRQYYPFCSKRCSEMDLHRWFSDNYSITGSQSVSEEEN